MRSRPLGRNKTSYGQSTRRRQYKAGGWAIDFGILPHKLTGKVPPRFELGSLDSESRVLTITPWNPSSHAGNRTWAAWVKARNPNH
ncbi:hypothetical protein CEXT_415911 [Caerostris extrusa]|uniref:Uncharacterized protein n=1 Tax=Caerostris extrusa TaxID=172846 RepID=A0AAV4SD59_CAEEX|nr:hypothetical protein CEXT_415911 [Caerostris extrusa]